MPRRSRALPTDLSLEEIRRLLAMKERMVDLEKRRADLQKELAQVESQLARITRKDGEAAGRRPARTGRKKTRKTARKAGRKATAKAGRKKAARKTAGRRAAAPGKGKRTGKKAGRAAAAGRGRRGRAAEPAPRKKLEDVIAEVIRARGEPIPFQELLGTITENDLFESRSKNFANVLRRTLSTSERIKRVGRGIYDVA